MPLAPGRGQPKTLADALVALEESRRFAAKLEATARQQHTAEQTLLTEMAMLREGLAEVKRGLASERDATREDLAKTRERLERAEAQKNRKTKESHKRLRQTERLLTRLKRSENEAKKSRSDLGRAQAELAEARRTQAHQSSEHENKLREVLSQVADLGRARDELTQQIKTLTASANELKSRADQTEESLKQRDEELYPERKQSAEAQQSRKDADTMADLLRRRLEAEQERRVAAEQRIEQLLQVTGPGRKTAPPAAPPSPIATSPHFGPYQRHAEAAGYDFHRDPLFTLMRRDVLVADSYANWQASHAERIAARRRDTNQTVEDQAYVAALAARWRLVDHPHLRLGKPPQWCLLGFLLDERSEKYLLTITQERIDEMTSRIGRGSLS